MKNRLTLPPKTNLRSSEWRNGCNHLPFLWPQTLLRLLAKRIAPACYSVFMLFLFTASIHVSLSEGEIHKYHDDKGKEHFVDSPEKIPEQYRSQATASVKEISRGGKANFSPLPPSSSPSDRTVKIYVTKWCGVCRALERFLKQKKIRFTPYDIEADPSAMREYKASGARGVPMIKVGSKILFGFNESSLLRELEKK